MAILESRTQTGTGWVKEGINLFKAQPRKWLSLSLAYVGLFMMLPSVPGMEIFALVAILWWPVFIALAVALYRDADNKKQQNLSEIFGTLKPRVTALMALGGVCLLYGILVSLILSSDLQGLLKLSQLKGDMTPSQASIIAEKTLPLILKLMLLLLPFMMATWFSPMLIAFNNYTVVKAIKSSIAGSIQYMVALSVAWLIVTIGVILLLVPVGIITGILTSLMPNAGNLFASVLVFGCLLLATSLMLALQYVSYRDVFRAA